MGITSSNESYADYLEEELSSEEELENKESQHPVNSKSVCNNFLDNCFDSATNTVDAVPQDAAMSITLSPDQLLLVENSLDIHEKVSLLFLLINDSKFALHQITKLLENDDNFIYKWAYGQNGNTKMQEALVEALCIIQNYEIVRLLKFNKENLIIRFSPQHLFTSMYANKTRKALYFICESLLQSEVDNMLHLLSTDLAKKNLHFKKFTSPYLELYFLYLEAVGYISHNNLSNICSILKQMGQLDLHEKLKHVTPPATNPRDELIQNIKLDQTKEVDCKISEKLCQEILNPSSSLLKLASAGSCLITDNVNLTSADKYFIDPDSPGVCLIINQESFYREIDPAFKHLLPKNQKKLESRTGTEYDKVHIQETFQRFGFKTIAEDNLEHTDIMKTIENVMMSITDESSLFVCILSHGDKGVIYGVNSCHVTVEAIKRLMVTKNRKHLLGKPKVLILQSCQGQRFQKVSSPDDDEITVDGPTAFLKEEIPPFVDLFTFWATVPGYAAIRNKKTGSWFIQSLCEEMKNLGNSEHFEDICTAVVNDVSNKKWDQPNEPVAMVPFKDSTFRKKFYLPPLRD